MKPITSELEWHDNDDAYPIDRLTIDGWIDEMKSGKTEPSEVCHIRSGDTMVVRIAYPGTGYDQIFVCKVERVGWEQPSK